MIPFKIKVFLFTFYHVTDTVCLHAGNYNRIEHILGLLICMLHMPLWIFAATDVTFESHDIGFTN